MKRRSYKRVIADMAAKAFLREINSRPAARVSLVTRGDRQYFCQHAPNGEGMAIACTARAYRTAIYRTPQVLQ